MTIKGRGIVKFPARVVGSGGITVSKSGGTYTIGIGEVPADSITGVVPISKGGTGATTAALARIALGFAAITLGGIMYGSAADTISELAGNTTTTRKFLRQVGNGTVSAAPAWDTLQNTDISGAGAALTRINDTNVTLTLGGSASTSLVNTASLTLGWTGQLAISRGGTGGATESAAVAALGVPFSTITQHSGAGPHTLVANSLNVFDTTAAGLHEAVFPLGSSVLAHTVIAVKKSWFVDHTGAIYFTPSGSDEIEGAASPLLLLEYPGDYLVWRWDGTSKWHLLGHTFQARSDLFRGTHTNASASNSFNPQIITNVTDNGSGFCRITVPSTALWTTGITLNFTQVKGVASLATTALSPYVSDTITVIDGTNIDLDNKPFTVSDNYTGGGIAGGYSPPTGALSGQIIQMQPISAGGHNTFVLPEIAFMEDRYRQPVYGAQHTFAPNASNYKASISTSIDLIDHKAHNFPTWLYDPGDFRLIRNDGQIHTTISEFDSRQSDINGRKLSASSTSVVMGRVSAVDTIYCLPNTSNRIALPTTPYTLAGQRFEIHKPAGAISKTLASAGNYGVAAGNSTYHDIFSYQPIGFTDVVLFLGPSYSGPARPTGAGTSETIRTLGGTPLNRYAIAGVIEVPALHARHRGSIRTNGSGQAVEIYDEFGSALGDATIADSGQLVAPRRTDSTPTITSMVDLTSGWKNTTAGVWIYTSSGGDVAQFGSTGLTMLNGTTIFGNALGMLDTTNPSHYALHKHTGDLTANRDLNWNLNDASRTISLAGNVTIGGSFTTDANVTFSGGALATANGGTNLIASTDTDTTFVSRVLETIVNGSTNDSASGSGAFVNHTATIALPANMIKSARLIRVVATFLINTGAAAPSLDFRLRAEGTTIAQAGTNTPGNNLTNRAHTLNFLLTGLAAPGASANVLTALTGDANASTTTSLMNSIAQPVALATNASIALEIGTQWGSAGTGTNTIQLMSMMVEILN